MSEATEIEKIRARFEKAQKKSVGDVSPEYVVENHEIGVVCIGGKWFRLNGEEIGEEDE